MTALVLAELQRRRGGRDGLAATYDKLLAVVAGRPTTRVITTSDGDIDGSTMHSFLLRSTADAPCHKPMVRWDVWRAVGRAHAGRGR